MVTVQDIFDSINEETGYVTNSLTILKIDSKGLNVFWLTKVLDITSKKGKIITFASDDDKYSNVEDRVVGTTENYDL